jgi:hypothetical protein
LWAEGAAAQNVAAQAAVDAIKPASTTLSPAGPHAAGECGSVPLPPQVILQARPLIHRQQGS